MKRTFFEVLILALVFLSSAALANSGITYQGRLMDPTGNPVTASSVQFKIQLRTPGTQNCLMYEEIQTQDLSLTKGVFSVSIGDGTGIRQDANSWSLFDALSNRKEFNFAASDCDGTPSYLPNPEDNRKFRVFFKYGSLADWEALPLQEINYIPLAAESYRVGGFPASSLLRVEDAGSLVNTTPLSNAQYTELLALLGGSSGQYEHAGELGGSALPSLGAGQTMVSDGSGGWSAALPLTSESDPTVQAFAQTALPTCTTGEALVSNGTTLSCVSVASGSLSESDIPKLTSAGNGVDGGAISGEIGGSTSVNTSGDLATTGDITAGGNVSAGSVSTGSLSTTGGITSTGDISVTGVGGKVSATNGEFRRLHLLDDQATPHYVEVKSPDPLTANYTLTLPGSLGSANQLLGMNNAGNALENKTLTAGTGVTITHSAGGIEIAASGSGGTVTSVTGTNPIIVDNSNPNTPIVSLDDSGVGVGTYGSATEVPVITVDVKGRITSASNTTISGVSPAGSNLATGKAWIGNGTGKAAEAYINVSDLKRSSDGAPQFPTTCNSGETLTWSSVIDVFTCSSITITKSQISDFPTLGTAAAKDFGSSSGNLVELDSGGKIPSSLLPSGAVSQWQDAGSDIYYDGGRVGVGTNAPAYLLDLRNANSVSQIHLSGTGNDDGAYFTAFQGTDLYINMGSAFDGSHWVAKNSNASIFSQQNGLFNFYSDTGLTPGLTYTPTERARLSYEGDLRLTGTMTAGEKTLAALPSLGAITAYSSDIWSGTSRGVNSVQISSNGDAAAFIGRKARGVLGAATTIQDGDYISMLAAGPYDGTDYLVPSMAAFVVNGTVATGSVPTDFVVHTGAMGDYGGTERFRITSTGKVGIGTADPSTDLEVAGTIKATAFEGPLTSTSTSLGDGSASSPSLTFSSDSNTGFYSSGADKIGVSAGGVKVWDITASGIVSPTAGGASISSAAGTAAAPTFSFAGDTDTGWFHPAVDTLAASTGGTERVRIDASGNVGIGTVNPQAPLQIGKGLTFYSGTSTAIGFNQYYDYVDSRWEAADSGYSSLMWLEKSTGIMRFGSSGAAASAPGDAASNWMSLALNPNGNVGIGTTNPGAKLHIQGSDGTVGLLVENVDSSSSRYPYATVTNYRGATDTSGYPVYHLINNRGAKGSQLPVQNGDWLGAIQFWGADSTTSGSANRGAQIIGIARETFTTSSGATDLAFFTSPSGAADSTSYERLRITSAGNVGIGTTTPASTLDLGGALRLSAANDVSTTPDIYMSANGVIAAQTGLYLNSGAGGAFGDIYLGSGAGTSAATQNMTIKYNGNVGIGTANPAYNLDLKGVLRVADTDTVGQIRIGDASGYSGDMAPTIWAEPIGSNRATWFLSQVSAGEDTGTAPAILMTARVGTSTNITSRSIFAIRNNTTDLMSVGATGNVGIGTTNPLAKLDVAGSIQFGSSSGSNKGYLSYYNVSPYNQAEVGSLGATTSLSLVTNNQSRLNITPAGNVGIGTVTPVTKLDVWGDVSVSGTTVHSSDRRLKEDIHPLENSLEKILQLNGYNYHWKNKQISPREQIGVIAQEVKEVFPDLVSTNPHTGFYSVNYEGLIPPLIEATKEIHHLCQMGENQAQSLSAQLARHERDIASLKEENAQQQQQIRELKEALCALSPKAEICRH